MGASIVLVFNAGSSSIKYQLIDLDRGEPLARGMVERIGAGGHGTHTEAVTAIIAEMRADDTLAPSLAALSGIGHRIVHGGPALIAPTLIDDSVLAQLDELAALAPLHNPPGVAAVRAATRAFGALPHVAVFDTGFFADLPVAAQTYAIPVEVAERHGIRRYGFHGISHEYVSRRAAELLGRRYDELRQIVFHLGNGASASAIASGRPVDTSMGFTPLEGLVMGTRGGDLDPGILTFLQREAGLDDEAVDELLNRRSGLLGLTGGNDFRDIEAAAAAGDPAATAAIDIVVHRLRKYLGAYLAVLGGADTIVFTAGIGEHSALIRQRACAGLDAFGVIIDQQANSANRAIISTADSPVQILVVPTNEELAIAGAVAAIVG